ncbi:MAG: endonuclease/exonuclease/phosphatase family protein [Dysgonamonadaceae bacterium]|nr:endonuclease/exonuclease/phosphatase family protein [Dysgonamonadaceae bacterium]
MKTKLIIGLLFAFYCFAINAQLNVATYNIRVDKEEDVLKGNGWLKRYPKICELIRYHDFDVFGLQEVESHQLKNMLDSLSGYSYTGAAREDGKEKGEFVPIFYKRDKLELLESGNFWLSETPDTPSKGWDAECYRVVSYGKFAVKKDGFQFWFFNTHFDHRGIVARKESARLILDKIKEIAKGDNIVLSGDFNADQNSDVYQRLRSSEIVKDSYDVSTFSYAWHGTANNFEPDIITNSRFDHIFVSPSFKVLKYGILTDTYRDVVDDGRIILPNFPKEIIFTRATVRLPSDHYPVKIELNY